MNQEFFTVDEVALLRFMAMCQESYTPDLWESFETAARLLISIRPSLRDGCFERIESYLKGERNPSFDSLGHRVLKLSDNEFVNQAKVAALEGEYVPEPKRCNDV